VGKATILYGGEDGLYTVRLDLGKDIVDARIAGLESQKAELEAQRSELETDLADAEANVATAAAAVDAAIDALDPETLEMTEVRETQYFHRRH